MTGTLYIVSTPIGNMEDITLRALRVLKEAGLIAAEDTRRTKKLLDHYAIKTPATSYFEHNEKEKGPLLIEKLKAGADIALVSDAGTPGISDPGYRLIKAAIENSIPVVSIPGPSALVSVLSVSGLPLDQFTFKGFIPSGSGQRRKFLLGLKTPAHTFVMYESPRRVKETVDAVLEVVGDVELVVAREMTKMHEEVLRGRAGAVRELIKERNLKGEVTIVIRTGGLEERTSTPGEEIEELLKAGFHLKDVVKAVAQEFDIPKGEVYREALRIKERLGL
ncbi:MAG: 16S rRNA (cytidine(1402)-2'-O)-methyltransferase [Deltaproteobacteria bacterium]|nr:16S rRNA (cytidine(1402)-2'-O)-methyltransferase [Deltaproteobacteria bacterium]